MTTAPLIPTPSPARGEGGRRHGRLRFANRLYLLALLQLAWLGWLLTFPVALDSDDALNFAHGVVRFSVLEFSPHFPGYPAFIWLARLINLAVDEPARAVQWASLLGSSLLAPLAASLAVRLWQRPSLLAPVWLLVLASLGGLAAIRRSPPLLAAWCRVGASKAGMASATVLLVFILIGLLDSLHYRVALEGKPGERKQYAIEVLSVLDAVAAPLRLNHEKTYSAPFATRLFAKENMDLPGGGVLRDYPRLRTGGRHLGEAENAVFADVGLTALKALGVALISWLAVVGLVIATVNGSSWPKIWRGETAMAWHAVLVTLGLILLIGLVAKNSILLVDVTNQFRADGYAVDAALKASCPLRLRPVLMTSLTVILAMLPAALGLGAGAETNGPLAVAVIGGMISSTLLTLAVAPAAYSLLENRRQAQ